MTQVKCRSCKQDVDKRAKKCGECGASKPGVSAREQLISGALGIIVLVGLAALLLVGEHDESEQPYAAAATEESQPETVADIVKSATGDVPSQAYAIDETRYLAVIFERSSVTRDYPLLQAKRLMPALLDRYPDIDRFYIAWAKDGAQFLKIQFEREDVQHARWSALSVKGGDLQSISSMYWATPALR